MLFIVPGMLAATASLGLVLLWDVDGGLTQIDKYLYSSEDYIKSGEKKSRFLKSICSRKTQAPLVFVGNASKI